MLQRLFLITHWCDASYLGQTPSGITPIIVQKGWEYALSYSSQGTGDPLSVDELIAIHPFIVASWPFGTFANDKQYTSGYYPILNHFPIKVSPKGPRQSDSIILKNFAISWKTRNLRMKSLGGESMCYMGPPPINWSTTDTDLDRWTTEARWALFDSICYDTAAGVDQTAGKTPSTKSLERLLGQGFKAGIESNEIVHPGLAPLFNGRFFCVSTHDRAEYCWNKPLEWHSPLNMLSESFVVLTPIFPPEKRVDLAYLWKSRGWSVIIEPYGIDKDVLTKMAKTFTTIDIPVATVLD